MLLDWYYSAEKPLPLDIDDIYRIARAHSAAERKNVVKVLAFFHRTPDGYTQKRADAEIASRLHQKAVNAETGKKGGRPRKESEPEANVNRFGSFSVPENNPSHKPLTNKLSGRSSHTPADADGGAGPIGRFEGHDDGPRAPNPAAPLAIALTRSGFSCTSMNPELVAYERDGGSIEHLQSLASMPECQGKKVGYLLSIARRELAETARPVVTGTITPIHAAMPQFGKTANAIAMLEADKHGLA